MSIVGNKLPKSKFKAGDIIRDDSTSQGTLRAVVIHMRRYHAGDAYSAHPGWLMTAKILVNTTKSTFMIVGSVQYLFEHWCVLDV
jgi:hypothetical protein